jgi:hypothetical protein
MEETIGGVTETVIIPEPQNVAGTDTALAEDSAAEKVLSEEIASLWSDHVRLSANHKTTAKELRQIRARLAERLHAMKSLLSRPGRAGQWRSWLRQQHIPRSTADRLVARHAETLRIENGNVLTGAIKPMEDTIEELVKSLLPRLRRKLADNQSVFRFIAAIGRAFGLDSDIEEAYVWVFELGLGDDEDSSALDATDEDLTEGTDSEMTGGPSREAVAT